MSPRITLSNWGSSSIDVERMILPILVRRSTPSTPPGALPSVGVNFSASGSSGRIERNFRQLNTRASRPTRGWAKKIGPGELSRTSSMSVRNSGEIAARIRAPATRSPMCLVRNCHPRGLVCGTDIRGSPPMWSTRLRRPTTSNMRGTIHTFTPCRWAIRTAAVSLSTLVTAKATTRTSAFVARIASSSSSTPPSCAISLVGPSSRSARGGAPAARMPTGRRPCSGAATMRPTTCAVIGPSPMISVGDSR